MFLDEAVVTFHSGKGGAGSASFHREKHVPRGGPNGADGGRGGDIVLIADRARRTLYDFKLKDEFKAQSGVDASGNKSGKDGEDIEIRVPVGTIVIDAETEIPLVDLSIEGMRHVLCKGGRGGFGNLHYTNSVRQAPTLAQKGAPGETIKAKLELKLLADVGLIGLPNAGKSTLISRISAAKPKIADYPFTTIVPNLGVVSFANTSFTVADMPGLIEGAAEGRGLGHQFLKHVERTSVLVHLVEVMPVDESDPVANYELIEAELKQYSEEIWVRPRLIALSKIDVIDEESLQELVARFTEKLGDEAKIFPISGVSGKGLDPLLHALAGILEQAASQPKVQVVMPLGRSTDEGVWDVEEEKDGFVVTGKRIERMVAMTDLKNSEALRYLHRRLDRIGVLTRLEEMGAKDGDNVRIGEFQFAYEADY